MKKFLFLSMLFIANFISSQNIVIGLDRSDLEKTSFEKAIIHFNDGTSVEGIGRLKTIFTSKEEVIIFKIEAKDKDETWTVNDATGITIITDDGVQDYEYLKVTKNSFAELYEVVTDGSVKLYKKNKTSKNPIKYVLPTIAANATLSNNSTGSNSNRNIKDVNDLKKANKEFKNEADKTFQKIDKNNSITENLINEIHTENVTYYLKKETEPYPTKVRDNYIKSIAEYMKDCDVMVEKIKNHEYNYSQIKDLVDYYNANCGNN